MNCIVTISQNYFNFLFVKSYLFPIALTSNFYIIFIFFSLKLMDVKLVHISQFLNLFFIIFCYSSFIYFINYFNLSKY